MCKRVADGSLCISKNDAQPSGIVPIGVHKNLQDKAGEITDDGVDLHLNDSELNLLFQDAEFQCLLQGSDAGLDGFLNSEEEHSLIGFTVGHNSGEELSPLETSLAADSDSIHKLRTSDEETDRGAAREGDSKQARNSPEISKQASIKDLKSLANHLQTNVVAFSTMEKQNILSLLRRGISMGLQPRVSNDSSSFEAQVPLELTKRRRKKRGPYKLMRKDSWTNCSQHGGSASCSTVQNASQNRRRPPTIFEERNLTVNDIELCRESMGEAKVRETPVAQDVIVCR